MTGWGFLGAVIGSLIFFGIAFAYALDFRFRLPKFKRHARAIRVKVRSIKTPAIRQRLVRNRAIIHASNEQALALKRLHDEKESMRNEAIDKWNQDFNTLAGVKQISAATGPSRIPPADLLEDFVFNPDYGYYRDDHGKLRVIK